VGIVTSAIVVDAVRESGPLGAARGVANSVSRAAIDGACEDGCIWDDVLNTLDWDVVRE